MNGEQLTVQINVDDIKCLYKDKSVLDNFVKILNEEIGQEIWSNP